MFSSISVSAINHVLGQHAWARDLLKAHAGKSLDVAVLSAPHWHAKITEQGLFAAPATPPTPPTPPKNDASNSTALADIRVQWHGPGKVEVQGDAELAMVLNQLSQHVRWDPAEDLAPIIGNAAAHQLSVRGQEALDFLKRQADALATNFKQQGAVKTEFSEHKQSIAQMMASIDAAEKKLDEVLSRRVNKSASK